MFVLFYLNEINECNVECVFDTLMDWVMIIMLMGCEFYSYSLIVFISFWDLNFYASLCDFGHTIYVHVDLMNFN